MAITIDVLRRDSDEARRRFSRGRPGIPEIRLILGVRKPEKPKPGEEDKPKPGPTETELLMRRDFYQLPNAHQTRSYNTQGAGSMDFVIRVADDANAIDRMPAGLHRDVVACVRKMARPADTDATLVNRMRRELREEQEARRDAFDLAAAYAEELDASDADRASIIAASQLREECRAAKWPVWTDPYIVMPNAVLNELAGGNLLGHRERAKSLGRSKFSYTSEWRGPYVWLFERWQAIYRRGLEMLDEVKHG